MRKYWVVFTSNLQRAFASRVKICTWGFVSSITPIIMLLIFSTYLSSGKTINGYDFKSMVTYYLSVVFVSVWVSGAAANVEVDIREGNLSNFIIKPMNYVFYRIPWEVAWYCISAIFIGLPLVILILIGYQNIVLSIIYQISGNILIFIPSLIMGYLISYFLSVTIGFIGFFVTETSGIQNSYEAIFEIFSGKLIPLIFFPSFLIFALKFLPFGYVVYFPSQILTGKIVGMDLIIGFCIQFIWVVITYILCRYVWNKGIKKFSAIGL